MLGLRKILLMYLLFGLGACSRGPVSTHPIQEREIPRHGATTPVERKGAKWWVKRNRELNALGREGTASLVLYGDSLMEGWEHMGRHALAQSFGTYETVVMGMGGDGTPHALWRAKNGNFKNLRPRVVVIMIGTNDLESQSEQEIVDGITAVAQAVNAITPDSKILLLGLFPRGEDRAHHLRAPIQRVNEGMQKLADDETIYYRDFGALLLDEDGTARREIQPDHLHLSREGYRVWAAALAPVVAELME